MAHRNPPVPLHDVKDVEGLCKAVALKSSADLTPAQFEDALGDLMLAAVEMSGIRHGRYVYNSGNCPPGVFDPSIGLDFDGYLGKWLPNRLIDWRRKNLGDSRNKTRPEFVPFEQKHDEALVDHDDFVEQITEAASILDDLSRLSPDAWETIETIVRPMAHGERPNEIADRLGVSRRALGRRLEDVRNELLGIALGIEKPTTDEIVEALHGLDESPIDHGREQA